LKWDELGRTKEMAIGGSCAGLSFERFVFSSAVLLLLDAMYAEEFT
jgi:hypothetical protein